ncbi:MULTISPECIES: hypothetical protein [Sphingomonadales]|jgi:hypothetical protein|uniref:Uncharacterized protein n=3 Tax=Sphingomonadales TaxID=204457 RepID=A0A239KWE7_9SPHN|nr:MULTISPECIES: hypothetical protein [Sphingomonadales]MEE4539492.1 hypothetical protein [Erythrobacter sp.]MDP4576332.1 hypothetical protein [Qipengyuania sp. G39]PEQ13531.1 hypothetical protein B2G71_04080 [Novosphingobium sp. PC22D]QSB45431.1 hypothetical protein IDJ81_04725 [Tsuneonella flava]SNT22686.1 hypothetical protein SAMN06295955_11753 [Sphingopyxis indica]|tara:strand:+ start:751 stop:933 length:183 start_codon:yes stop_codon:yes gene_type:complete
MQDGDAAETQSDGSEELENRVIAEIVELQREFYFENRNKDSERRRRLRDIIDRATPLGGD